MLQNNRKAQFNNMCLTLEGKTVFDLSPFTHLIKNSCLNKTKLSSGFAPFKHGHKNKLSEFFNARFCGSYFYV